MGGIVAIITYNEMLEMVLDEKDFSRNVCLPVSEFGGDEDLILGLWAMEKINLELDI